MQINRFYSCKCGLLRGVKFRDIICKQCNCFVTLREEIETKKESQFILFIGKCIWAFVKFFIDIILYFFDNEPMSNKNTNFGRNGKGSDRRPMNISDQEFSDNWDKVFKKKSEQPTKPPEEIKNKDVLSYE